MMKSIYYLAIATLLLVGCDQGSSPKGSKAPIAAGNQDNPIGAIPPATQIKLAVPPYSSQLLSKLPESTLAFVQIPSLAQLLGNPNPSLLQVAHGSSEALALRNQYRTEIAKLIEAQAKPPTKAIVDLLMTKTVGQLEIAFIQKPDSPMPVTAIAMQLEPMPMEQLAAELAGLAEAIPPLNLARPLSKTESAHLMMPPAQAFLRFNATSGQVHMVAGLNAREKDIKDIFDTQTPSPLKLKRAPNFNGLMLWLNGKKAWPIVRQMAPPHVVEDLSKSGLMEVQDIHFSVGTADKKGRLLLDMSLPSDGWRNFLPIPNHDIKLKSAGPLEHLLVLTLPSSREMRLVEAKILETAEKESVESYFKFKQEVEAESGKNFDDWFDVFGPEMLVTFDDAGSMLAVKLKDKKALDFLIEKLKASKVAKTQSRKFSGRDVHFMEVNFPIPDEMDDDGNQKTMPPALKTFLKLTSGMRLYWSVEDDYLLMANVPQVLKDRFRSKDKRSITGWLNSQNRQSMKNSLMLYAGLHENLPRDAYYLHLRTIDSLGLMLDTEQSIFDLPSALDLNLPKSGSLGFQFDASKAGLSIELSYENSMLDLFHAGGVMETTAVIGILAAIAVPAYQDYTLRAEITEIMLSASKFKVNVESFYEKNRRFPTEQEITSLNLSSPHPQIMMLTITPDSGEIIMYLQGKSEFEGGSISFIPQVDGAGLNWACTGTLAKKYLPASCRE